jgi:hypothetical protein
MTTDRSALEKILQSYSDFLKSYADKLDILFHYSFIEWQLSCFYKELKLELKIRETAAKVHVMGLGEQLKG